MAASPEQALTTEFLEITGYIPQVPLGSVAVGSLALDFNRDGTYAWDQMLDQELEGGALEHAVSVTNGVHTRMGLPENPGLRVSLPFAWELVRVDLASAFSGTKQDTIGTMTPELASASSEFVDNNRTFVAATINEAKASLRSPSVSRDITLYKRQILTIARQYRGLEDDPANPEKMDKMNAMRTFISGSARTALAWRLSPLQSTAPAGVNMLTVAHNLTRWEPSPELVAKHFGRPE